MLPALIIKSSLRSHRSALSLLSVISVAVIVVGAIVSIKISQSAADSSTAVGLTSNSGFKCSATGSNATVHVAVPRATPNGSGDDFAAIQAAIDAADAVVASSCCLPEHSSSTVTWFSRTT